MGTDKELSDLLDFSMVSRGPAWMPACVPRLPGAEAYARNTPAAQSQTSDLAG